MKYLIFEQAWQGHRLEYIHHQYIYAGEKLKNDTITIAVHPRMKEKTAFLEWPAYPNVQIIYFSDKEAASIRSSSMAFRSWQLSKLLKKYNDRLCPDKIIINNLLPFMPSLPLLFWRKRNLIRGIIYRIPRQRSHTSIPKSAIDQVIFSLLAKSRSLDVVWLLNDLSSAKIYNERFNVSKFSFLPDPINVAALATDRDMPPTHNTEGKTVFLHAGGMGIRKGTFTIIDAIKQLPQAALDKSQFIFAGYIPEAHQRDRMLEFIREYEKKVDIIYPDAFIPFEDLVGYFRTADYILIPYMNIEQSSGILGYSAYFNKPVIGPKEGLLGELISTYRLGIGIENITPEKLREAILSASDKTGRRNHAYHFSQYVSICQVKNFAKAIFH